jgi:hypothetical protein
MIKFKKKKKNFQQNDFHDVNISNKFLFFDIHCFITAMGCANKLNLYAHPIAVMEQ